MSLIKSAIVYKAEVPTDATTLHNHLAERSFQPPSSLEASSAGFVPPPGADSACGLVATFAKGLAFAVRVDEKVIPGSVVRAKTDEAVAKFIEQNGRKPGKVAKKDIKEQVMLELLAVALVRTRAIITCYYHAEKQHLVVSTTSKKLADICTSLLIMAVGSVKTQTIHVSGVKHGLTTRLKNWIHQEADNDFTPSEGEQVGFGNFTPADNVALTSSVEKRKITVNAGDLMVSKDGILEAILKGAEVRSLGLATDNLSFRLTDDFHFKSIEHGVVDDADDESSSTWEANAAIEMANLCEAIDAMAEMFAYKEEEAQEAAE